MKRVTNKQIVFASGLFFPDSMRICSQCSSLPSEGTDRGIGEFYSNNVLRTNLGEYLLTVHWDALCRVEYTMLLRVL